MLAQLMLGCGEEGGRSIVRNESTFAGDGGGVTSSMEDPDDCQFVICRQVISDIGKMEHRSQSRRQLLARGAGGWKMPKVFKTFHQGGH